MVGDSIMLKTAISLMKRHLDKVLDLAKKYMEISDYTELKEKVQYLL